jgi:hypothetical protein
VAAVGDEISRMPEASSDLGLRGGDINLSGGKELTISLHSVRWVTNATIDRTAAWISRRVS